MWTVCIYWGGECELDGRTSLSSERLSVINNLHNILYVLLDINALNIHSHNDGALTNRRRDKCHVTFFLIISASKYGE